MLAMPKYEAIIDEVTSMYQEVVSESQPHAEAETEPVKEEVAEAEETPQTPDEPTTDPESEQESETEVAEAEADESDDDEDDPLKALRELTKEDEPDEDPIELNADQELLLQDYQSQFSKPENLLRHAVRQAQTAESGIKHWKERAAKALELAKAQYPEFDAAVWKPNVEAKLRQELASKKGWSHDDLNDWVADNEDVFNRAVEAEVLKQKSEWDTHRAEKLKEISEESEKIGSDLTKRNSEKAAALKKRYDKYAEKMKDDPVLQSAMYDALTYDGDDAPPSDEQRFLDAQNFRNRAVTDTLKHGRNLGKDVEDAALARVLKSDRLKKLLVEALRPKAKAEPTKKVKMVAKKSAGAEETVDQTAHSSDSRSHRSYNERMGGLVDQLMSSVRG